MVNLTGILVYQNIFRNSLDSTKFIQGKLDYPVLFDRHGPSGSNAETNVDSKCYLFDQNIFVHLVTNVDANIVSMTV